MSLTLYFHPLSSFCMKVLVALYENGAPFAPQLVDLGEPESRDAFLKLWPIGKFPVLRDEAKALTIPESSIIIEHLDLFHPGAVRLVPADAALALRTRQRDRFFDLYVNTPMQKIVTDRLRPAGENDKAGVEQARALLRTACAVLEQELPAVGWAMGLDFTLADCAAAPGLFYADKVEPLAPKFPKLADYLARLRARPSFARTLAEAQPYFKLFPQEADAA